MCKRKNIKNLNTRSAFHELEEELGLIVNEFNQEINKLMKGIKVKKINKVCVY